MLSSVPGLLMCQESGIECYSSQSTCSAVEVFEFSFAFSFAFSFVFEFVFGFALVIVFLRFCSQVTGYTGIQVIQDIHSARVGGYTIQCVGRYA